MKKVKLKRKPKSKFSKAKRKRTMSTTVDNGSSSTKTIPPNEENYDTDHCPSFSNSEIKSFCTAFVMHNKVKEKSDFKVSSSTSGH